MFQTTNQIYIYIRHGEMCCLGQDEPSPSWVNYLIPDHTKRTHQTWGNPNDLNHPHEKRLLFSDCDCEVFTPGRNKKTINSPFNLHENILKAG